MEWGLVGHICCPATDGDNIFFTRLQPPTRQQYHYAIVEFNCYIEGIQTSESSWRRLEYEQFNGSSVKGANV